MAIHDYVIDNQSAPAFRSDLNGALQAIVTQNSNPTAPTTTYANMIWYDTVANQLKKRNEANSAWIVLGTIDEGTGTFTPSGERALASQAEAEAGTDNTKLMTPLRSAQAIATLAPPPTTASVLSAIAGATAGAVGTYIWARAGSTDLAFGSTRAGSSLNPTSGQYGWNSMSSAVGNFDAGTTQSGTWRAMGTYDALASPASGATLWLRIS